MEIEQGRRAPFNRVRSAVGRAHTKVSGVIGHVLQVVGDARHRADEVVQRLPSVIGRVRAGAQTGVTGLQKVPDAELGLLAAASIGLGTGLRLAGAPRLATLAGFVPASILGLAIFSRRPAAGLDAHEADPTS